MQILTMLIFVVVVGLGGYVYVSYKKCAKLLKDIEEQFMTTDVYFKQRLKVVPKLVEIVRGYAEHEKATYDEIDSILAVKYTSLNRDQKEKLNNRLAEAIAKVISIVDGYQSLKSSAGFIKMEDELSSIEREIIYGIRDYNKYVDQYNKLLASFPMNILAESLKMKPQRQFENLQRANLKLSF